VQAGRGGRLGGRWGSAVAGTSAGGAAAVGGRVAGWGRQPGRQAGEGSAEQAAGRGSAGRQVAGGEAKGGRQRCVQDLGTGGGSRSQTSAQECVGSSRQWQAGGQVNPGERQAAVSMQVRQAVSSAVVQWV